MQLFELVSPRLFRPLAGPNRAFYAELLLLLWEECRHTADYSISRAEAVSRAEDYFAALAKPLALDADGAGDEDEQPTRDPHTLAVGFLLRLRRTGWLEETPGSYEGEASLAFVPEVAPLLEALEESPEPPRSHLHRQAVQGVAAAGRHRAGKKPLRERSAGGGFRP
ncbi:Wadjet anti-phage system protein JetA family protein [Faecalibacterium sp. 7]|uniref:Wadjet anti-phage system protein JetA family protein n=1 Tax=Faecalibacterium sp. 7 TaxID=3402017 RepID=UPI003C2DC2D0